jgi:hypothetical protein
MTNQTYADIVTPELSRGAILHRGFPGFVEDYLCLHCLIKIHKPKTFFEVGCNIGKGTKIIKNAMGLDSTVYSLDLPTELAHISLQHPISEGKGDCVGWKCDLPFILLRGDSMDFDYSQYPCEGYFIDGEHDRLHVLHESTEIAKLNPNLITWHDADTEVVYNAIVDAMAGTNYDLYRVTDTRMMYALKKEQ